MVGKIWIGEHLDNHGQFHRIKFGEKKLEYFKARGYNIKKNMGKEKETRSG